jgi:hypothetical protein
MAAALSRLSMKKAPVLAGPFSFAIIGADGVKA